jgi:hypothetical protein
MSSGRITIAVNAADLNHLRQVAAARGQTITSYVARLVSSDLASQAAPLSPAVALRRASSVVR